MDDRRRTTDDGRRTTDEKFEIQVFLAAEAAVAEAAVVETAVAEVADVETVLEALGSKEHCWQ